MMQAMDEDQMQEGKEWLEELLKVGALSSAVQISPQEDSCWLTINEINLSPHQISALTGTGGEVLDALQYLINTVVNLGREEEEKAAYTVELNGYRERRYQELSALAENAAKQVRQTGVELEIKSLSSVERRLIHNLLKDSQDIETYSRGQEPDRRLVIKVKS
ncbi:protein jag [Capilliphycus salinus ALCB114379]|uniref:Jag family protein n=1 Tax=Capilliphycus salinus TaxID=2768948 RepID=UPI0039A40AA8